MREKWKHTQVIVQVQMMPGRDHKEDKDCVHCTHSYHLISSRKKHSHILLLEMNLLGLTVLSLNRDVMLFPELMWGACGVSPPYVKGAPSHMQFLLSLEEDENKACPSIPPTPHRPAMSVNAGQCNSNDSASFPCSDALLLFLCLDSGCKASFMLSSIIFCMCDIL